ncbi:thymidine kinase [Glaciecola sp. MH2013]|uniref:thymidine kinase n=1 Tax=Glaciecola sp. MH2013 TaxID=2785524 RepID=UPI00189CA660|nr:thymidine kinase [Glaciecola sp. MH2013]MBF7072135.1 thymidine kinase [Glaciecola sp. MH2013]
MAQLYFYYSAMNAGKSTSLLQSAYNYKERGMNICLFTAALDDRYGTGKIASRIGLESPAELFSSDTDLFAAMQKECAKQKISCLFIDEAQFMSKQQVIQCLQIVDTLKIPVLAYGLRTDFRGQTFEGSHYLLAWADKLSELKTVCHCGRKANFVARLDEQGNPISEGDQVDVGGNEKYVSLCRKHFMQKGSLL